jgi:hypothetical protein
MMQTPTEFQLSQLMHLYDPQQAHEYYIRTRKLKGRKKGQQPPPQGDTHQKQQPPPPHRRPKGFLAPREEQKVKLKANIQTLELKLHNLEELIRKKEAILAKDQQQAKSKATQNTKAKGHKPQSKADKAKAAKKYRQSHKQSLKNKAKAAASKGGHGSKGAHTKGAKSSKSNTQSIAQLKALATRVKGQLAIAKQKLAAL